MSSSSKKAVSASLELVHAELGEILRTPADRFDDLEDYPFAPHWAEVDGLRIHYVDEGPDESHQDDGQATETVVMLHGEPSWSYLYRSMIPICAERHRVIVPDLVGFGKSDKPAARSAYTYARHVEWIRALLFDVLDLRRVTLVCQDWGSLIGLRIVAEDEMEHGERFARVVVGNGFLPTGDESFPLAFKLWKLFALYSPIFPISAILQVGSGRVLDRAELRAYSAPFPSARYKAGARVFPALVPTSPDDPGAADNHRAWDALERWDKPFLTTFSHGDPITRGIDRVLRRRIPGAEGLDHRTLRGGHFLQEDAGPEFAAAVNELIASTPSP